jgi:hypothetical protein
MYKGVRENQANLGSGPTGFSMNNKRGGPGGGAYLNLTLRSFECTRKVCMTQANFDSDPPRLNMNNKGGGLGDGAY